MPASHPSIQRFLVVAAGIALVATAFLVAAFVEVAPLHAFRISLVVIGSAFLAFGLMLRAAKIRALLAKVSLAIIATVAAVTLAEVIFRVVGFDFERFNEPGKEIPIYYRRATVHAGNGIFRRRGPASWRGQALRSYMHMLGTNDGPYAGEPPVLAEYDALGFRNPTGLTDWNVVVTGDSFVELGFLSYDDLFTTVAAKRLGIRIKNLGVSGTGPISQTFYVKEYGKAPSTRDAVLCFHEGNDIEDLQRETRNVESFRATGKPWERHEQVSFVNALLARLSHSRGTSRQIHGHPGTQPNALLLKTAPPRPMTVYGTPPAWHRLNQKKREAVIQVLDDWGETVRAQGMQPWVMFLPDSHRVFHGMIRYADTNGAVARWAPGEFGAHLGAACSNLNIRFIDTFPTLRKKAEAGEVPYNLVGDTHLSREGSRIVAEVLADALKAGPVP